MNLKKPYNFLESVFSGSAITVDRKSSCYLTELCHNVKKRGVGQQKIYDLQLEKKDQDD